MTNTKTVSAVNTMYGFEARSEGQWSREAAGEQGPGNYLATREEAEAQVSALAAVLECSVDDVRVVAVSNA